MSSSIWPYNKYSASFWFYTLYFISLRYLLVQLYSTATNKKLLYKTDSQWELGEEVIEMLTIIHWISTKNI